MSWIRQEPIDSRLNIQQRTSLRVGGPDLGPEFDTSTESGPSLSANIRTNTPLRNGGHSRKRVAGAKQSGYVQIRRRSLFTWIVGGFFTLVWIFLLGIMVGRGTITNTEAYKEVEQILAMDRGADSGPAVEVVGDSDVDTVPPPNTETHLTFYDSLSQTEPRPLRGLPEPEIRAEEMVAPPSKSAPPKAPVAAKPKSQPAKPPAPKPRPTATRAPEPKPGVKSRVHSSLEFEREELLPSLAAANQMPSGTRQARLSQNDADADVITVEEQRSLAPPPDRRMGENFTIQVSAARTIEDADREVQKLRAKGYDAYTYQVELKGRKYFRIRVGRYQTREEADTIMKELAQTGRQGMFLSALTD